MRTRRERRYAASSLFVFALVLGNGPLWGDEKTEQMIADLEAKVATVTSYQADMTMTFQMMGVKMNSQGKMLFKKPKKARVEMVMDMGMMKLEQTVVSDGKMFWICQPKLSIIMKIDVKKVAAETKQDLADDETTDLSKPFGSLQRESIAYVREERVDGKKALVFQALAKPSVKLKNVPFAPDKIELWVGADDGLIRKLIMLKKDGKEMMSQSYSNVQVNVEIPESQFEFTPPKGAQVMDMTEMIINMMKEMKDGAKEPAPDAPAE